MVDFYSQEERNKSFSLEAELKAARLEIETLKKGEHLLNDMPKKEVEPVLEEAVQIQGRGTFGERHKICR